MKYVFHPDALAEYAEAVKYYATQNSNIAQAFINSIEEAVYRIRESSTRYPEIDEDVRRCMVHKFPYAVLYTCVYQPERFELALIVRPYLPGQRERSRCSKKPTSWRSRFF